MLSAGHACPGLARPRQATPSVTPQTDSHQHSRSCRARSRRSARWKPVPAAAADLETASDTDWETKYGGEPLEFGLAALQGPRETMEDFISVIPQGRCGFLVACKSPDPSHPHPFSSCWAPGYAA